MWGVSREKYTSTQAPEHPASSCQAWQNLRDVLPQAGLQARRSVDQPHATAGEPAPACGTDKGAEMALLQKSGPVAKIRASQEPAKHSISGEGWHP